MAPISSRMRQRYDVAVHTVSGLMYEFPVETETAAAALSELKGMFNRYVRKDQWDYAMVGEELGNPPAKQARLIANDLQSLRRAVVSYDEEAAESSKRRLERNGILQYLDNYQTIAQRPVGADGEGWIYVLSRRDQPNILKIGRTDRSVSRRVKEINAATGILFPFGARYVYRVNDSVEAERLIHQALDEYRVRQDREFFDVQPSDADSIIRDCLHMHQLRYRTKGTLLWFDTGKFYGFIATAQFGDVFVHGSEVHREKISEMSPGVPVDFVLHRNLRGHYATQVTVSRCTTHS